MIEKLNYKYVYIVSRDGVNSHQRRGAVTFDRTTRSRRLDLLYYHHLPGPALTRATELLVQVKQDREQPE